MSERKNSLAVQRIDALLDENSFVELGSGITSRNTDFNLDQANTPSDGVVTGHGLIDGNLVFVYSQDPEVCGGSIGEMHAKKITNIYRMAVKMGAPVIGILDSTGVRLQESYDALEAIGSIYQEAVSASGVIPQIVAVYGKCGGGLSVLAGVSDFTFVSDKGSLFLNAPDAIPGNNKDAVNNADPKFQFEYTGIVDAIGTEDELSAKIRELVTILPGSNLEDGCYDECLDDLNRASEGLEDKRLDPAAFAEEISDNHLFFETKKAFAKSMTTGFIKLDGATVGVVGNKEKCLKCDKEFSTELTADAVRKAADFVRFCDAFDIPVLTLTNVAGYEKSIAAEGALPKALASFAAALASATVPKVNLITKEAFGTAYILMNSKSVGADLVLAYPDADMGIMDAAAASKIIAGDNSLAESFAETQSGIGNAIRRGYIDRVVNFADTRKYLIAGFEMLATKQVDENYRKHSTK